MSLFPTLTESNSGNTQLWPSCLLERSRHRLCHARWEVSVVQNDTTLSTTPADSSLLPPSIITDSSPYRREARFQPREIVTPAQEADRAMRRTLRTMMIQETRKRTGVSGDKYGRRRRAAAAARKLKRPRQVPREAVAFAATLAAAAAQEAVNAEAPKAGSVRLDTSTSLATFDASQASGELAGASGGPSKWRSTSGSLVAGPQSASNEDTTTTAAAAGSGEPSGASSLLLAPSQHTVERIREYVKRSEPQCCAICVLTHIVVVCALPFSLVQSVGLQPRQGRH